MLNYNSINRPGFWQRPEMESHRWVLIDEPVLCDLFAADSIRLAAHQPYSPLYRPSLWFVFAPHETRAYDPELTLALASAFLRLLDSRAQCPNLRRDQYRFYHVEWRRCWPLFQLCSANLTPFLAIFLNEIKTNTILKNIFICVCNQV